MAFKVKVEGADDLALYGILPAWSRRFTPAFSKRAGGVMRGRTRYAVRRRTGRLRKSVRTTHTTDPTFGRRGGGRSVGAGRIGTVTFTSEITNEPGYFAFVTRAVERWSRSRHARRTGTAIGRRTMRKTIRETQQ